MTVIRLKTSLRLLPDEQEAIRKLIDELGESAAFAELQVARPTMIRAAAGQAIRRGTAAIIRGVLAKRARNSQEGGSSEASS